jgi:hypothetical protein
LQRGSDQGCWESERADEVGGEEDLEAITIAMTQKRLDRKDPEPGRTGRLRKAMALKQVLAHLHGDHL